MNNDITQMRPSPDAICNLQPLQPSRKKGNVGDVFVMFLSDGLYMFGRVIATDAVVFQNGSSRLLIVYIFRARSRTRDVPWPLLPNDLLLPPIITNRQGWLKGYFETVARRDLHKDEFLDPHCFFYQAQGKFCDGHGHDLKTRLEPCGDLAVKQYHGIGIQISRKIGLPTPTREEFMAQYHRVEERFRRRRK